MLKFRMDELRYARNISFAPIGKKGQEKLCASTAAVIGLGAVGTPAAAYLARAGVNIILIDHDIVEKSNLQRQILYTEKDALGAVPKAEAAKMALESANPDINIDAYAEELTSRNMGELLGRADIVIDATDNLETRFRLNDWCVKNGKAWVFSAAIGDKGMSATMVPGSSCLRCFMPKAGAGMLPTCESEGIMGPAAGIAGAIGASEAIKYITGAGKPNTQLLHFRLLDMSFELIKINKDKACKTCGKREFEFLEGKGRVSARVCADAFQINYKGGIDIGLAEKRARKIPECRVLLASRTVLAVDMLGARVTLFGSGKAIVKNCATEAKAKNIAAKLVSA